MLESSSKIFWKIEHQEINLDDFLSTLENNKNRLLEQEDVITQELIIEQEELIIY
jgi:hypothetical protein